MSQDLKLEITSKNISYFCPFLDFLCSCLSSWSVALAASLRAGPPISPVMPLTVFRAYISVAGFPLLLKCGMARCGTEIIAMSSPKLAFLANPCPSSGSTTTALWTRTPITPIFYFRRNCAECVSTALISSARFLLKISVFTLAASCGLVLVPNTCSGPPPDSRSKRVQDGERWCNMVQHFFVSARGQVNLLRYLTIESTPTSIVKIC